MVVVCRRAAFMAMQPFSKSGKAVIRIFFGKPMPTLKR
jgi:hypothetical protein